MNEDKKSSILDQLTQKERHDFKNALLTLDIFGESLKEGYKFDDSLAEEKCKLIIESIQTLKKLATK